jgi:CubicO group peptidase (beta-lactamase class C family)
MSAAPMAIAQDAAVRDWPIDATLGEAKELRPGTNGWVCRPDDPTSPSNDPRCLDANWLKVFGLDFGSEREAQRNIGISYMLQGDSVADNDDPSALVPPPGKEWQIDPPHIMVASPRPLDQALYSTDHHSGGPWIMFGGTPAEHLMAPVEVVASQDAADKIANAMSAAPMAIAKDAMIIDWPVDPTLGEGKVLREGTNGWVCRPDDPASPTDDPRCLDQNWLTLFGIAPGAEREALNMIGFAYMLQGDSVADNNDPAVVTPPAGEEWQIDPPHLMVISSHPWDPAAYSTNHHAGGPWIMFGGTPAEHLMVPVTDAVEPLHAAAAAPTFDVEAGLQRAEAYLDEEHELGDFAGAALIARDGEIIWSKAWGMANREQGIPNTPQTIFRVYEMSVQFTAAAMLLLEQQGKLSVQDPICTYLDDCPDAWKSITIHHLLSHTSGLSDYFEASPSEAFKLSREGATVEQIVALFRDKPLLFTPGERRYWSHAGFVLAGQIIERVSGQSYSDFMNEHIFAPLGMLQSGYGDPAEGLALGYRTYRDTTPVPFDVSSLYASGGVYSTAEDLFRWNEALYNGELLNDTQLQKMLTWHDKNDSGQGSGYGIVVGEYFGRPWAGNGGYFDGYAAVLGRYLNEHITTVLIGNQDMLVFDISDEMEQRFFGAD